MLNVMKRREAAERGVARYYTGKACKYGHASERYTSSGACIDCQNTALREIYRSRAPRVLRPGTRSVRFAATIPADLTPVDFLRLSQEIAVFALRWTEAYMQQRANQSGMERAQAASDGNNYALRCCILAFYWADVGVTPLQAMEWQAELIRRLVVENAPSIAGREDYVRARYVDLLNNPAALAEFLEHPDSERARRDLALWIESREPVRPYR